MKILVTGANGMVARAAAEHCRSIGDDVIALTRAELDIADRSRVFDSLRESRPEAVINCAAFTDVDGAESRPEESRAANTFGVGYLAEASKESGARFVTISTDYVFDGNDPGFYTEVHRPNPVSVYGRTKLEGEHAAAKANADAIIVRSGWIYGQGGTNFLSVMHRLLGEGKKIKAISNAYGTPTFAGDLVRRLRDLVEIETKGIFHVTNAGPGTSYLGFAQKVCELGGFDTSLLEVVENASLKRPAPRPVSSKLASIRETEVGLSPLRDWETALAEFLVGGSW